MNNILRTSIISVGIFALGAATFIILDLGDNESNTVEETHLNNNTPFSAISLSADSVQFELDQQNKIAEITVSLNVIQEEIARIGKQQAEILKQQKELEKAKDQPVLSRPIESIVNEVLSDSELVISDEEIQVELEQRYDMYDSLYQSSEDDPHTATRIQDAFQVLQTNDDVAVGAVNCSGNVCRMQTTVTNSDAANEFVDTFPEILPWGTQAAYFINIQPDGSAQITHFFATEGASLPVPEYLDGQ